MKQEKPLDTSSKLFLTISLVCIFIFWFISLSSVFYIHKATSSKDVAIVSSFLEEGFTYTEEWEFLEDLWNSRPSLMALSFEVSSEGEELYSIFSYRNYYKSFLPFQETYLVNLDLLLLDESLIRNEVKLIYSLLPWQEFIYYSFISFFLFVLIFIVYFFLRFSWS